MTTTNKQNPADQREAPNVPGWANFVIRQGGMWMCFEREPKMIFGEAVTQGGRWGPSLSAPPESVADVPDGWKLVPIEPTPEMIDAGYTTDPDNSKWMQRPAESWRDMVAAAPPAPAREPLTIAQINEAWDLAVETSDPTSAQLRFKFTRAIEIAHNIKAAK